MRNHHFSKHSLLVKWISIFYLQKKYKAKNTKVPEQVYLAQVGQGRAPRNNQSFKKENSIFFNLNKKKSSIF